MKIGACPSIKSYGPLAPPLLGFDPDSGSPTPGTHEMQGRTASPWDGTRGWGDRVTAMIQSRLGKPITEKHVSLVKYRGQSWTES